MGANLLMKRAFDETSVIKTLKDGIAKGYWTIEDLDQPSPGSRDLRKPSVRTPAGNYSAIPLANIPPHRNFLREAERNPVEKVQVIDPKDFPYEYSNIKSKTIQVEPL